MKLIGLVAVFGGAQPGPLILQETSCHLEANAITFLSATATCNDLVNERSRNPPNPQNQRKGENSRISFITARDGLGGMAGLSGAGRNTLKDSAALGRVSFLGYWPLLNRSIRLPTMANLIITYWRDIPSAVSVRLGRKEEKRMLDNRFMEAIDMAAMRGGATDTDSYLADWRRAEPILVGDDLVSEVEKAKSDIEATYDKDRLKTLIANGGKLSS